MPAFTYSARDREGNPIEGIIEAANSALAAGRIREMGYELDRVRLIDNGRTTGQEKTVPMPPGAAPNGAASERKLPQGRPEVSSHASEGMREADPRPPSTPVQRFKENFVYPVSSGVPLSALVIFYRQFATMINAGLPLYQSLVTLESQTRNPKLQGVLRDCQRQVEKGGKLSDVLEKYPWIFNRLQIEMIRAAEAGGLLDVMLNRIADYLEQEMALRRLINRLTLYPKIVVFAAWMILGIRFFVDATPAFSKLIIGMMKPEYKYSGWDYLIDAPGSMMLLGLIIFGIVAFCKVILFQSEAAEEKWEQIKMSIPGVGDVAKKFALARFGRSFGALYAAGMPLSTAIRVGGDASGSKLIARATRRVLFSTERGAVLSQAFRETGVFPNIVLDMMHTGEQTGNLDQMMTKVSEYLEGDAEQKAHLYSHIFATVVGLIVAMFVGYAVIKFYMGYLGNMGAAANEAGKD